MSVEVGDKRWEGFRPVSIEYLCDGRPAQGPRVGRLDGLRWRSATTATVSPQSPGGSRPAASSTDFERGASRHQSYVTLFVTNAVSGSASRGQGAGRSPRSP